MFSFNRRFLAALAVLTFAAAPLAGCINLNLDDSLDASTVDAKLPEGALPGIVHTAMGLVPQATGLVPTSALLRGIGHDAGEPTIGITSKGTIFYAAIKFAPDQTGRKVPMTDVLRSRDNGLTWEDVTPKLPTGSNSPPQTGDPYIYVDPTTDRVFNYDMFPALACGYLSFSDDEGDSWTTSPIGCGTPPPYDHQTLAAGKPRLQHVGMTYPNVVYSCVNRVSDSICARSFNGGLTWTAGTPVFLGVDPSLVGPGTAQNMDGFCGGLHGHVVAAPDGTVYLPRSYCGRAFVGISEDDGTTWRTVMVSDVPASDGPDPAVAVDAAGNVYYTFISDTGALMLTISRDAGKTWSEAIPVHAPAVTAAHLPAIAAGDEGKITIAYAGTENLPDGFKNAEFEPWGAPKADRKEDGAINSATWNGYVAVITNALADVPVIQTTRVNDPMDPLVRGYCGPGRCPGMYDFIDVVIGPDGRAFAPFVDACIEKCATPEGTYEESQGAKQGRAGLLALLATGPKLSGGEGALPTIA